MHRSNLWVVVSLTIALASLAVEASADDDDKRRPKAPRNVIVDFGQPQPQTPAPAPVGNVVTHFLAPDDVTVTRGGTVTFVVNGGGHGIAIHTVSRTTKRADIAKDLCQGGANEADRAGRNAVCNAGLGTQNLAYQITDGRHKLVIDVPANVANANPRVDDAATSPRLLATSGAIPGVFAPDLNANPAGAFLVGTVFVRQDLTATPPILNDSITPGNRIQIAFNTTGRFLVICMNRGHMLNDHMFGFVDVVDGDGDDDGRGGDDRDDNNGHGGHN
jgi:hypothetical protein